MTVRIWFRLGVAATVADIVTTFVALRLYVGLYEANPFAAHLVDSVGLEAMLAVRLAAGVAVCWFALQVFTAWRAKLALAFAAGFWFLVAASNAYEIARLR